MRLIILVLLCLSFGVVWADDLIIADFEVNNQNYTTVNSGILNTLDYFTRTFDGDTAAEHVAFNSEQGTYYFVGRDIIKMTGTLVDAQIILNNVDVSSYTDLQVSVLLAAPSGERYENIAYYNEDWIKGQYSYDGTNWTNFVQFTGNVNGVGAGLMAVDTDYNGVGDGTTLSDTFQNFTLSIPDGGSTLRVRFLFYATSGTEVMAIDNIKVSGTVAAVPPSAVTISATDISTTEGTLNGTVNANGFTTSVTFEYGLTTSYGTSLSADQSPVTGSTDTAVSTSLSGLDPNTTYHYRVVGSNTGGTTNGTDLIFTTDPLLPPEPPYWQVDPIEVIGNDVYLEWNTVDGAISYSIYRSDDPNGTFSYLGTTASTTYVDSGAAIETKYFYYVTADNAK